MDAQRVGVVPVSLAHVRPFRLQECSIALLLAAGVVLTLAGMALLGSIAADRTGRA